MKARVFSHKNGFSNLLGVILGLGLVVVIGLYLISMFTSRTSPFSQTSNQTDSTATWQTYANDQLGISFKYPASWEIKATPQDLELPTSGYVIASLFPPSDLEVQLSQIIVDYYGNLEHLPLETFYHKLGSNWGVGLFSPDDKPTKIANGITAYYGQKVCQSGNNSGSPEIVCHYYVIPHKNEIFLLTYMIAGKPKHKDIFDRIASTFTFTQ